jgi:hypothetical protein
MADQGITPGDASRSDGLDEAVFEEPGASFRGAVSWLRRVPATREPGRQRGRGYARKRRKNYPRNGRRNAWETGVA